MEKDSRIYAQQRRVDGKTAIVTGAGQGIGFEIARQLSAEGAIVFLNDIDTSLSDKAANKINVAGGKCKSVPGDSGDLDFINNVVANAVSQTGKLDIVVANAGITLFGDFFTYSYASLQRVMNVNLAGTFFYARQQLTSSERSNQEDPY